MGKLKLTAKCKDCIKKYRQYTQEAKKQGTYVSKVRKPRLSDIERNSIKEANKQYHINYRKINKDVISKNKKLYLERIKIEGILAYGGKCVCCGESTPEFLTIEHLNGRQPSKRRLTGKQMWAKAKSEGYPLDYTVLCFNCNCAKGAFGVCPHQKRI